MGRGTKGGSVTSRVLVLCVQDEPETAERVRLPTATVRHSLTRAAVTTQVYCSNLHSQGNGVSVVLTISHIMSLLPPSLYR